MPKLTAYPNLRTHTRKGAKGQVWVSYYWDGRASRVKDAALGNDWERALVLWADCQRGIMPPPIVRTKKPPKAKPPKGFNKKPPMRQAGKRRDMSILDSLPAWAKRFYLGANRRAQEARRAFTLTPADVAFVIERAAGKCEVTGIPLRERQEGETKRHAHSPSIDRIDSLKGYERGNIRVTCLIANLAMNEWGESALHELAESVLRKRLPLTSAMANLG